MKLHLIPLIPIIMYLVGAFTAASFSITEWDTLGRLLVGVFSVVLSVIYVAFVADDI